MGRKFKKGVSLPSGIILPAQQMETVETGELLEEPGKVRGLWRIPDFASLLERYTYSPKFLFMDACWWWRMDSFENGMVGLYLFGMNCSSPKEVRYSFGIRNASGEEVQNVAYTVTFDQENQSWGTKEYIKLTELQCTELTPAGVLTICYSLRSDAQRPSEGSLFRRLWNMSLSLSSLLSRKKSSDVTLKLKDGKLSAHRMILASRSPVFKRMFDIDMRERKTGLVNIKDATKDAFQVVLYYAYGGVPKGLSCENVCEVYKMAHRYEFDDLRKFCTQFMRENLNVETICDVVTVADVYQDMALKMGVKDFFVKNKSDIFKSEAWKKLKKDNSSVVCEMLEFVISEVI